MTSHFLTYLRHELNRAPLTVEAYGRDITQFKDWIETKNPGQPIDFTLVSSADVRAWLSYMGKQGDSPRTLRRKIISLRSLFKWMLKSGMIETSPLHDIALPKMAKPLPDFVRSEEVEEAIKNISHSVSNNIKEKEIKVEEEKDSFRIKLDKLILEMLYSLGIRRAELININDSDISFDKAEIKLKGKRSKQRVVPVPQQLLAQIKEWQQYRDLREDKVLFDKKDEIPLLLIKGKRIRPERVYRIVKRALSESTARKKSPHALRHSFASGMLNGGAEIDSVREFLGHASLATTQIYTHVSIKEIKKAYQSAHPRSQNSPNRD